MQIIHSINITSKFFLAIFILHFSSMESVKFQNLAVDGTITAAEYVPAVPFNELPTLVPLEANQIAAHTQNQTGQTLRRGKGKGQSLGKSLRKNPATAGSSSSSSNNLNVAINGHGLTFPPPNFTRYVQVEAEQTGKHSGDQFFDTDGNCWQYDFSDGMLIYIPADGNDSEYMELTMAEYQEKMFQDSKGTGKTLRKVQNEKRGSQTLRRAPATADSTMPHTASNTGSSLRRNASKPNHTAGQTLRRSSAIVNNNSQMEMAQYGNFQNSRSVVAAENYRQIGNKLVEYTAPIIGAATPHVVDAARGAIRLATDPETYKSLRRTAEDLAPYVQSGSKKVMDFATDPKTIETTKNAAIFLGKNIVVPSAKIAGTLLSRGAEYLDTKLRPAAADVNEKHN